MQLVNAGVPVSAMWADMAKSTGKSRAELLKMKEAGQLTSTMVLPAIANAIKRTLGESQLGDAGAQAANETIDGLTGRIKADLEDKVRGSVKAATPGLVKGFQAIFGGVSGVGEDQFSGLTRVLETLGVFLEKVGPKIPEIAENFLKAFGDGKMPSLDNLVNSLPGIAEGLGKVAAALEKILPLAVKLAEIILPGDRWYNKPVPKLVSDWFLPDAGPDVAHLPLADTAFDQLDFSAPSTLADGLEGPPVATPSDNAMAFIASQAAGATDNRSVRTVGAVNVTINTGAGGDPDNAHAGPVPEMRSYFEDEFGALLERHLEGVGAP